MSKLVHKVSIITTDTKEKKKREYSKQLIADVRCLLWFVTLCGLILAAYCIYKGYHGTLPWLSAMVGLPWSAHGIICSLYLNMAKSDHREGGITFETAKANNFGAPIIPTVIEAPFEETSTPTYDDESTNSPAI